MPPFIPTLQSEDPDVDRIVRELEGQEVDDPQSEAERLRTEYAQRQEVKRQRKTARGVRRVRKKK